MFQKVDPSTQRHDFHPTVKTQDAGYQTARSLPFRYAVPQCRDVMRSSTLRSVAHPLKWEPGGGGHWAVEATCPHSLEAVGAPRSREGEGSGGNLPPQLGSCGGAAPQLWTVNVIHFYFRFFLHVNLGLSQKIVDQIREVFSFG